MFNALRTMVSYLAARFNLSISNERGATMVEYGLMVALIAVVVAVGAGLLGTQIDTLFDGVTTTLQGVAP